MQTFGRWADLKRHHNGAHAAAPTIFWCEYEGCPRSRKVGNSPFPRKDKLGDHVRVMHEGEDEEDNAAGEPQYEARSEATYLDYGNGF